MKQRKQIISESLHEICTAIDTLREIAVDLTDCDINTTLLTRAVASIEGFKNAVKENELRPTLAEPQPPHREDPPCIACGAPESVCECGDQTCPLCEKQVASCKCDPKALLRFASFEAMGEGMTDEDADVPYEIELAERKAGWDPTP